jgi:hypothetical protein
MWLKSLNEKYRHRRSSCLDAEKDKTNTIKLQEILQSHAEKY